MMKKPSLKTQMRLCIGAVWAGALLAVLSKNLGQWCLWLGLAIVVVAALCRYSLIRCPHCGYKLAEGKTIPKCCPNCKEEL